MIKFVISCVGIRSGGPLSIIHDLLSEISLRDDLEVTVLVSSKSLYYKYTSKSLTFIEFPKVKKSWFIRVYFEYIASYFLSKQILPNIWLSMHDITPNVKADFICTYFHNPSPFYKISVKDCILDPKFLLFNLLYKYIYKINFNKNNCIFVQQEWMKYELYNIFGDSNIVVVKPYQSINNNIIASDSSNSSITTFFYPSLPRVFKNFEVIFKASEYLINTLGRSEFKIFVTIDGGENRYAKSVVRLCKNIKNIKLLGLITRQEVFDYYKLSDVLIFPSKLETWGLPISEFKEYKKPIIVSNLKFAKETVGNYKEVSFFDPDDYKLLANIMKSHIDNNVDYDTNTFSDTDSLTGWHSFVDFVLLEYKDYVS